ncbi:MAG: peroxiredoxin [Myxococcota bacterium]
MVKVGEPAPDFEAVASNGTTVRLSALRGRHVVLYFFPKAFTPGCTAQTRRFRDNYPELAALGAEVMGVSIDTPDTQCRFAQKETVPFPMIADPQRTISRAFGVLWPLFHVDKRVTFVIDPGGVVEAVFHHEFQVNRHLDDVVRHLKKKSSATAASRRSSS